MTLRRPYKRRNKLSTKEQRLRKRMRSRHFGERIAALWDNGVGHLRMIYANVFGEVSYRTIGPIIHIQLVDVGPKQADDRWFDAYCTEINTVLRFRIDRILTLDEDMSLQTEAMRDGAAKKILTRRDAAGWQAFEMVNHPTPSGCERWLMTYSDNRRWPTAEQAVEEFSKILPTTPGTSESLS